VCIHVHVHFVYKKKILTEKLHMRFNEYTAIKKNKNKMDLKNLMETRSSSLISSFVILFHT